MTVNVMEKYIDITKKQIRLFMSEVMGKNLNKFYVEEFLTKYINVRYYDFYVKDMNSTYRQKIIYYLKETKEDLIINNISDRIAIENTCVFFYYVLYIDNVSYCRDLKEKMSKLNKLRYRAFGIEDSEFEQNIIKIIREYDKEKKDLIKKFETDEFFIKISAYQNRKNVYRINLKQKINFPKEYSEFAIHKAFNMGLINEDKLIIEYYLTVLRVIDDVLKLNFKRQYIVEFAPTLLEKNKKIKGYLNTIDSNVLQDKITLKIRYEDYTKYKELVQELMREGYRFAIILDSSFEADAKNIELLKIFKYVLLNVDLDFYDEVKSRRRSLGNVIEI